MSKIIKTKVEVNINGIVDDIQKVLNDTTMTEIHNLFAKMMEPYVPFSSDLANLEITPEYVKYDVPYAHYHYIGDVYGLNIPIIENGIIVGWFSKPDENGHKHPTGHKLNFKKARASDHWDQAMLEEKKEEFIKQVEQILARRAKEIYG